MSTLEPYLSTSLLMAHVQQETSTPAPEEEKNVTATTSKGSASPPRRPLTRSQTGTVPKRRARDDSDHIVETKKRTSAPRKKQKTSSSSSTDSAPAPTQDASSTPSPSDSAPSPTREASLAASTSSAGGVAPSAPANGQQLTFYHAASTSGEGQQLQADLSRLPRSRATLPTPIPNLTKKSRGRRVPTQDTALNDPERKDHRLYVCTVDGCGKCFHRGEHLKRHIRSIHTHEKRKLSTFWIVPSLAVLIPFSVYFYQQRSNAHFRCAKSISTDTTTSSSTSKCIGNLYPKTPRTLRTM